MKRRTLLRHLERHGCYRYREGANHAIYRNPQTGRCVAVPRHQEIKNTTARTICKQLDIPPPVIA